MVGLVALTVAFGLAPQIVCVKGLIVGVLISGSTLIAAVMLLLGHTLPAIPKTNCTVLLPTPKPLNIPVLVELKPLKTPGPVNTLQLPTPMVGFVALTVAVGLEPQIVCVKGLIVGVLISGSTLITAVILLLGHTLPAIPKTYCTVLLPTPKPLKIPVLVELKPLTTPGPD